MIGGEADFARAPRSPARPNSRSSSFPQTTRNTLARVEALGGKVVHPGERWAVCRDSKGSAFGLARS